MKIAFAIVAVLVAELAVAKTTLEVADRYFLNRRDPSQARLALTSYRQLLKEDPANSEILWRVAMACQTVGYRIATDEAEKKSLYWEGKESGRLSLVNNDRCVPCHFWTAINMALYAENNSSFQMLLYLKEIRAHLAKVIELDPKYAKAGAHRVMGIIEWRLPGILGGSNREAERHFSRAIELLPQEPLNYPPAIEFFRATGQPEKAQALIQATLPEPPIADIESWETWREWKAYSRSPLAISSP